MSARVRFSFAVCSAVLTLAIGLRALPQGGQAPLPDGRTIIDHYVEAIGGKSALGKITSVRMRGRFELVAQNITGSLELLTMRPDKALTKVEVPAYGHVETGYDGKIGWLIDPQAGPSLLSGRMLSELADDSLFDGPLHLPALVHEVTTVERTEYDHRPAYKLHVQFVSGLEQFEYYDAETNLLLGWEGSRATPMGVLPASAIFRDYRTFGATKEATTIINRALGADQQLTIESCDYNVVQASAFDPPAVIKALIK